MGPAQNLVVHNKCYPWMGPFDLISGNLDRKLELLNRTFLQFKICDFEDSGVPNRSSNRKMHHPRANPLARSPSFNPLPQKPDLSAGILVVSLHDWMFFFGRKWSGQKVRDWVITHLATNLFHQPRNPLKCRLSTRFFLGGEVWTPETKQKKRPQNSLHSKERGPFWLRMESIWSFRHPSQPHKWEKMVWTPKRFFWTFGLDYASKKPSLNLFLQKKLIDFEGSLNLFCHESPLKMKSFGVVSDWHPSCWFPVKRKKTSLEEDGFSNDQKSYFLDV